MFKSISSLCHTSASLQFFSTRAFELCSMRKSFFLNEYYHVLNMNEKLQHNEKSQAKGKIIKWNSIFKSCQICLSVNNEVTVGVYGYVSWLLLSLKHVFWISRNKTLKSDNGFQRL